MALKKDVRINTEVGVDVIIKEAYIKISGIYGSKDNLVLTVSISDSENKHIKDRHFSFTPTLNEINFIKQGYEHLKALEEFKDAEDC